MDNHEEMFREFDRRLTAIENQMQQLAQKNELGDSTSSPIPVFKQPPPVPRPTVARETRRSRTIQSSNILAFIGTVFVLLAGVFFVKVTIESGWLTPLRQVILAAATGLTFFALPAVFARSEKEYGAWLAGVGIAILHLTWVGAYFYHLLLSIHTALVFATLVGFLSLFAKFGKATKLYFIVALAGTYISAILVSRPTELSTLSVFLVIWNLIFSVAGLVTKRREIIFIAGYYAIVTIFSLSDLHLSRPQFIELLVIQFVQLVISSIALVAYWLFLKKPFSKMERAGIACLLLLFYFSSWNLLSKIYPHFAPWYGIIFGASVLGIYLLANVLGFAKLESNNPLSCLAAITFVHSLYFEVIDDVWKPFIGLVLTIIPIGILTFSLAAKRNFQWPLLILMSTYLFGLAWTFFERPMIGPVYYYNLAYGIIPIFYLIATNWNGQKPRTGIYKWRTPFVCFGHLEIMLGLYHLSKNLSWSGTLFLSISWGIYAVLILLLAYWRRDKFLGNTALIILFAVSVKASFYDLNNTNNLIRVGCLFVEGLLLYGCGWLFKKMQSWK